ncbi:hypothetical protein AABD69_08970 [Edwardsiella piscicida]|uniref:phage tail fiber protein n=1 Tax=Edwardsiella piscicida TaxID=1263550 RepID=UPI000D516E1F|nr:hypothetical protein [Edwardsiella piscicida]UCQ36388.1 hypothetical protein DCF36_09000 [Edwardsiella piscicida]
MPLDITSANSKLRLVVPAYYPGGIDVDDYAADNMFDTAPLQNAEEIMSADGKYHAGFVFNPADFTITLMPTSSALGKLEDMVAAERTAIAKFVVNATLVVPSLNKKWTMVNGVLFSMPPLPPGRRILQPRPVVFHFETITPSAV